MSKPYWKYLASELYVVVLSLVIFALTLLPLIVLEIWLDWPKHSGIVVWLVLWIAFQSWRGWRKQA